METALVSEHEGQEGPLWLAIPGTRNLGGISHGSSFVGAQGSDKVQYCSEQNKTKPCSFKGEILSSSFFLHSSSLPCSGFNNCL